MSLVARLSMTPVKGTALHHPQALSLGRNGMAENRRFYLIDAEGRLLNGKQHGPLVRLTAEFDAAGPHLRIRFPGRPPVDGRPTDLGQAVRTNFYGREVAGHVVEGPWSAALSEFTGRPVHLVAVDRPGDAVDAYPVTLVSTATIDRLRGKGAGAERLDHRRFRMLIEVDGGAPHEEDTWIGGRVRVGESVLRVAGPVPRCLVTNQNPETGLPDFNTLKAIVSYRGELADDLTTPVEHLPDGGKVIFGVYAEVEQPGTVRVGDRVEVLGDAPASRGTSAAADIAAGPPAAG